MHRLQWFIDCIFQNGTYGYHLCISLIILANVAKNRSTSLSGEVLLIVGHGEGIPAKKARKG